MKWFKHDTDASNDTRLRKLKQKFGMEGYGVYFNLLEIIARKMEDNLDEFGFLPKDWDDESLLLEFGQTTNTLQTMFDYMCEIGLFEKKQGRLYNSKIQNRCDDYTARILRRDNYNSLNKPKNNKCPNSVRIKSDKVRLEENRIDKNRKEYKYIYPTIEEVKTYCLERNNGVDYEKWFNFYSAKGWLIGKNKMKDWRAAVRTWEDKTKKQGVWN